MTYTRIVRNVYERSSMFKDTKAATPPRWMFWEDRELQKWFDEVREAERE
jgi:hypothetical protein